MRLVFRHLVRDSTLRLGSPVVVASAGNAAVAAALGVPRSQELAELDANRQRLQQDIDTILAAHVDDGIDISGSSTSDLVALLTCSAKNTAVLQKHINKSPSTPVAVESKPDPRRALTKADVAQMVADYGAGQTMREIGQRHKVSRLRVGRILAEQGVESRMRPPTSSEIDEIIRLYESGLSLVRTGEKVGFDPGTVQKYLLEHSVTMRSTSGV